MTEVSSHEEGLASVEVHLHPHLEPLESEMLQVGCRIITVACNRYDFSGACSPHIWEGQHVRPFLMFVVRGTIDRQTVSVQFKYTYCLANVAGAYRPHLIRAGGKNVLLTHRWASGHSRMTHCKSSTPGSLSAFHIGSPGPCGLRQASPIMGRASQPPPDLLQALMCAMAASEHTAAALAQQLAASYQRTGRPTWQSSRQHARPLNNAAGRAYANSARHTHQSAGELARE